MRLRRLVDHGLTTTEALWPPIRTTYGWVHRAARLLANEEAAPGMEVQRQLDDLLGEMQPEQATVGPLTPAVAHFLKVSACYWPGLFHSYDSENGGGRCPRSSLTHATTDHCVLALIRRLDAGGRPALSVGPRDFIGARARRPITVLSADPAEVSSQLGA